MQQTKEKIDFLRTDWESMEGELEVLSQEQTLRMKMDSDLEEALQGLEDLTAKLPKEQGAQLLELCSENVINTVVGRFGLASLIVDARDGGAVTTAYNFKDGTVATAEDKARYENWQKSKNATGKDWQDRRKELGYDDTENFKNRKAEAKDGAIVKDDYTGKELSSSNTSAREKPNLDHIVSAKEWENDPDAQLFLSSQERVNAATDDKNLAWTSESINKSMQDTDNKDWANKKRKNGKTNAEEYEIDNNMLEERTKEAQTHKSDTITPNKMEKYSTELLQTGAKDATKIAMYSALGVVLKEFAQGMMIELIATFKNGGDETLKEIFHRFKTRFSQIVENLKVKWKEIFTGSLEEAVIAFLSNLLVFAINLFATTLKRIVKIIRAGFGSLYQAVKILVNPPKDMPKEDVMYEALKVLTAGIIGGLSLGFSEGISKLLNAIPPLVPILNFPVPFGDIDADGNPLTTMGDVLSTTIAAIAGGLLTTIALYYMDKCNNQSKTNKLQIQIMTQGGVVVQYKIAQNWFVLSDAYLLLLQSTQNNTQLIQNGHQRLAGMNAEFSQLESEKQVKKEKIKDLLQQLKQ